MKNVLVNCRVTAGTIERNGKAPVHNIRVPLPNSCPYPFPPADPEPEGDDNA